MALIHSESVETSQSRGVRGYDGGSKIEYRGRKRHLRVDSEFHLLDHQDIAADVRVRNGAGQLVRVKSKLAARETRVPRRGIPMITNASPTSIRVAIVCTPEGQRGVATRARRCVLERSFVWINGNRRHAMDAKAQMAFAEALPTQVSKSYCYDCWLVSNQIKTDSGIP